MLKAVFSDGIDEITITGLTQWDTGQKLEITLADLPTNFEVHFAQYRRSEIAYVVKATSNGGVATVSIPNKILQVASKSACAWIYIPSDDGHETIKTINLPIKERARPADYVYKEEEILYFEKVMGITEQAAQRAEEAQTEAEQSANECKEAQGKIEGFEEYNRNNYSNSLKAKASGEVVRVDDVSPAQHNVAVKVRGKNLLKQIDGKSLFGITMTVGDDGGYTFNGTATGGHFSFTLDLDLDAGAYAIAAHNAIGIGSSGADAPYIALRSATNEWLASRVFTTKDAQIIFTTNEKIKSFLFAIPEGVTVENYTIYLQLEEGNTITEYEPYIDPSSVKVTRYGVDETDNLQTYTPNADGTVDGILSVAPTMTILTDTEGANLEVEYNQDINVVAETTIKNVAFGNGATITLANNTCFVASEPISNLTIIYPTGNYICSLDFTLASEGNITITLPESKYIGDIPTFINGATWELNIKNGVVIGGRVA